MNTITYFEWVAGGKTSRLYMNAITSQTHEFASEVSEHPVEEGANVTDYVRRKLNKLSFEAIVSQEPITADDNFGKNSARGAIEGVKLDVQPYQAPFSFTPGAVFSAVGNVIKNALFGDPEYVAQVLTFKDSFDAVTSVQSQLSVLMDTAQMFTVYTSTNVYSNMQLIGCTLNKTPEDGTGAKFNLEFQQIRIVSTKRVKAPIPTEVRGQPPIKKGNQGTPDAPPQREASVLIGMGVDPEKVAAMFRR